MPTYVYACTACSERLEAVQRISDDPLTVCPACDGALRKVIQPVGVVFKGSGFYKTDSRSSGSKSTSATGSEPATNGKSDSRGTDKPASSSDSGKSVSKPESGGSAPPASTGSPSGSPKVA